MWNLAKPDFLKLNLGELERLRVEAGIWNLGDPEFLRVEP